MTVARHYCKRLQNCKRLHYGPHGADRGGRMVDSPPTIYDVAARAGVSTATVSRALNSLSSVRPSTREKVFAAMEELEFVPNVVARGLSSGKHWILGLVFMRAVVDKTITRRDSARVEEASLLYTDIVIRGAEMRAAEHGYSLLLSSADERHPSGLTSLLNLTGTVDGLILLDRVLKEEDVAYLARRIPVVLLAGRGNVDSVVTVRVDNEQAMRSLAEHLRDVHGVTRFGFVTGADESPDSVARADAFRRSISELGGTLDDVDFLKSDWTSSGGEARDAGAIGESRATSRGFRLCERPNGGRRDLRAQGGRAARARRDCGDRFRRHLADAILQSVADNDSPVGKHPRRGGCRRTVGDDQRPKGRAAHDRAAHRAGRAKELWLSRRSRFARRCSIERATLREASEPCG